MSALSTTICPSDSQQIGAVGFLAQPYGIKCFEGNGQR